MLKGLALGQLYGSLDFEHLHRIKESSATMVRFELAPLSPYGGWTAAEVQFYQEALSRFWRNGQTVIGLLNPNLVLASGPESYNNPHPDVAERWRARWLYAIKQVVNALPAISVWEVWNEPNVDTVSPSNLAGHLDGAYRLIKGLAPHETVLSGSLFCHNIGGVVSPSNAGATYWSAVLEAQERHRPGHPLSDGLALHPYLERGGHFNADHLRTTLNYFPPGPLWLTECGWSTVGGVTQELQAANTAALLQAVRGLSNVAACCVFTLADQPKAHSYFGLTDVSLSPKPAFEVFKNG